jgi:hypothetical protein
MYGRGAIRADRGKHVVIGEPSVTVVKLAAVLGEKDGTGSRPITNAENITFIEGRSMRGSSKRIIVTLESVAGKVANRDPIPSGHSETRIGLGCESNDDLGRGRLLVHFRFKVVDLVYFRDGQVGENGVGSALAHGHARTVCEKCDFGA